MARVVVQRVDVLGADGKPVPGRLRAGEVVDILPDGLGLGRRGAANPDWHVVEFPGAPVEKLRWLTDSMTPEELAALVAARAKGMEGVAPQRMRAWRLAEAALETLAKGDAEAFKADPTLSKAEAAGLVARHDVPRDRVVRGDADR